MLPFIIMSVIAFPIFNNHTKNTNLIEIVQALNLDVVKTISHIVKIRIVQIVIKEINWKLFKH